MLGIRWGEGMDRGWGLGKDALLLLGKFFSVM